MSAQSVLAKWNLLSIVTFLLDSAALYEAINKVEKVRRIEVGFNSLLRKKNLHNEQTWYMDYIQKKKKQKHSAQMSLVRVKNTLIGYIYYPVQKILRNWMSMLKKCLQPPNHLYRKLFVCINVGLMGQTWRGFKNES